MNVVLWSACQEMQNQIRHLKGEISKLENQINQYNDQAIWQ